MVDGSLRCVQRRARPRPLHLNLFPTSTPPLINYCQIIEPKLTWNNPVVALKQCHPILTSTLYACTTTYIEVSLTEANLALYDHSLEANRKVHMGRSPRRQGCTQRVV